jgi:hypothetical protein
MTYDQFGTDPQLDVETDFFILAGHPYTCNGGNPDFSTHHDHEVILVKDGSTLRCPECGRTQPLKRRPEQFDAMQAIRGLRIVHIVGDRSDE